jgi:5-methylcytosine-specific restriction endonuclease McrA
VPREASRPPGSLREVRRTPQALGRPDPSLLAPDDGFLLTSSVWTEFALQVQITVSRETHDRLRRAQDLLRHSIPDGDVAAVFDRALTLLIDHLEKQRFAATSRPRDTPQRPGSSRHIPATVRREVWARDEGRCAFVGSAGRCAEKGFLEFHHVVPFAAGGAGEAANIQLRCRSHNAFESELFFGTEMVRETRAAWG